MQDDKGPTTDAASLVRQLVCSAVHSKAAYGHAMAAGHLSSLYNFALLQTVSTLSSNLFYSGSLLALISMDQGVTRSLCVNKGDQTESGLMIRGPCE